MAYLNNMNEMICGENSAMIKKNRACCGRHCAVVRNWICRLGEKNKVFKAGIKNKIMNLRGEKEEPT